MRPRPSHSAPPPPARRLGSTPGPRGGTSLTAAGTTAVSRHGGCLKCAGVQVKARRVNVPYKKVLAKYHPDAIPKLFLDSTRDPSPAAALRQHSRQLSAARAMLSAARRFLSTPGARAFAARGAAVATAAAGVGAFSAQCDSIKLNVTIPVEVDVDQLAAAASREQLEAALKKGKVGTADSLNILLQE